MKSKIYIFLVASFFFHAAFSQNIIKGIVVEKDTNLTMPFVYIINKSNGNGTMSDNEGRFSLVTNVDDTLILSYVGFAKSFIPVKSLLLNSKALLRISMIKMPINLKEINITSFRIKPYERDYMNDIIDRSKVKTLDYFNSPFTALYNQYSKEGKQLRKLAKIFEDLIEEEQVQKKLSREILTNLTGDKTIDYFRFRKYCYNVNNYFIITHDGIELYTKVMDCYKRWKREGN